MSESVALSCYNPLFLVTYRSGSRGQRSTENGAGDTPGNAGNRAVAHSPQKAQQPDATGKGVVNTNLQCSIPNMY